jgi:hypothetical protein
MLAAEEVVLVEPPPDPAPLPPPAEPVAGADDGLWVADGVVGVDEVVVVDGVGGVVEVVVVVVVVVGLVVVVVDGVVAGVVVVAALLRRRLMLVYETNSLDDEPTVRLAPVALELEPVEDDEDDEPFSAAVS